MALRKERHRLDTARLYQKDNKDSLSDEASPDGLVQICCLVARLYQHHPQMHVVCEYVVFYFYLSLIWLPSTNMDR